MSYSREKLRFKWTEKILSDYPIVCICFSHAQKLNQQDKLMNLPSDFGVSFDHTLAPGFNAPPSAKPSKNRPRVLEGVQILKKSERLGKLHENDISEVISKKK